MGGGENKKWKREGKKQGGWELSKRERPCDCERKRTGGKKFFQTGRK